VLALAEHDHAAVADVKAAGPVVLVVDTDLDPGRYDDPLVEDDPAEHSVSAYVDTVEQHAALDIGTGVHVDAR
jgi:ribosomal protein S2